MNERIHRVVAFIPVRGGSKSIPLKNIRLLAGKPLVQWVIEAAVGAECIDRTYISTDSEEIASTVRQMGLDHVDVVGRSPVTATDEASSESALLEFCENCACSHVFFLQATSPLLTSRDLDIAWGLYSRETYDSLLSVVRQKRFLWELEDSGARPVNYQLHQRPRRQEFPGFLVENGAFYLSRREDILESRCRLSKRIGLFEMSEETYYELDEPSDWHVVERLFAARERADRKAGRQPIRMVVTDCDGVLTDGGMYYSEAGEAFKKFNTRDGKGIERLRLAGFKTAIITGEETPFIQRRAEKLHIDYVLLGARDKSAALLELSRMSGFSPEQMAYIGDDVNDLPAIRMCGVSACPANAEQTVKDEVDVVLDVKGGEGAFRRFADMCIDNEG